MSGHCWIDCSYMAFMSLAWRKFISMAWLGLLSWVFASLAQFWLKDIVAKFKLDSMTDDIYQVVLGKPPEQIASKIPTTTISSKSAFKEATRCEKLQC